jgi:DNA topoisomerase-1
MLSAPERAKSVGLHYSDPEDLPLRRRKSGAGFSYVDHRLRAVRDAKVKARLAKLAVPPAWEEVRLARDPLSHIQAVGRDAAGRLQYRYHERWSDTGEAVKLERLLALGRGLAGMRREVERQLRRSTVDQAFATAVALALLDRLGLRVGYPEYSREDGGRGATTLTRRDVAVKDGRIRLRFDGKGGKRIQRVLEDAPLARAVALLRAAPGEMLFRWKDAEGADRCLTADDVNTALRSRFGETSSARDFRTFRASAITAGMMRGAGELTGGQRERLLREAVRFSAEFLANTPTVARKSYVHPAVQARMLDEAFDPAPLFAGPPRNGLNRDETALLRLLAREAKGA